MKENFRLANEPIYFFVFKWFYCSIQNNNKSTTCWKSEQTPSGEEVINLK